MSKPSEGRLLFRWQFIAALAIIATGYLLVSFGGLTITNYRLNQRAEALQQEVVLLKVEHQELEQELVYLQTDEGLERLAREELGWVKSGEIAVIPLEKAGRAVPESPRPTQAEQSAMPNW